MNLFLTEILLEWKRNSKMLIMLIALTTIGIFCINIASTLLIRTEKQAAEYNAVYEEIQFCSVLDNFVGDCAEELEDPQNISKFKEFLTLLTNSEYFEYFMMYDQHIYIENYKGKENNIYGYEYTSNINAMSKEIPDKNGILRKCTATKTFWIGDNVIDYFKLSLSEGRNFKEEEFIFNPSKPIPIILGANYADEYDIGDSFFIHFIFSEGEANVVGFLEEGSNVYYRDNFINLDRYVILPVFLNDDYEGKKIFNFSANHFYTLRNSGVIAANLSLDDVQKIISDYSSKVGFEDVYYIVEYDDTAKNNFDLGIKNIAFLICIIVILIIISMIILITFCITNKINRNKRYYAILMLNGCGQMQICIMLLLETLEIFIISNLLAWLIFISIIGLDKSNMLNSCNILLYELLLFALLPCIITIISFLKNDLANYLKGEIQYAKNK